MNAATSSPAHLRRCLVASAISRRATARLMSFLFGMPAGRDTACKGVELVPVALCHWGGGGIQALTTTHRLMDELGWWLARVSRIVGV